MAKNNKPFAVKGINVTSPKGTAKWCKIKEPDYQYNDKGILSTQLICDPEDAAVKAFVAKLEELRDVAYEETKETLGVKGKAYKTREVYSYEEDSNGEETGNIVFKFNLKDVDDRDRGVTVVDSMRQVIKEADLPLVGNGSSIRCVAYANPYSMPNTKEVGISLIWSKMQVIELVEYAGGSDDFEDEDGFESKESDKTDDFKEEDDDDIDF